LVIGLGLKVLIKYKGLCGKFSLAYQIMGSFWCQDY